MRLHAAAEALGRIDTLDRLAHPGTKVVKQVAGPGRIKDLLSGSWLGHPLHPLLTDITIGSLTSATILDLWPGRRRENAADLLVAIGLISAAPTVAAGAADWSDTDGEDQRVGVVHALSNMVGLGLFALSLPARRRDDRRISTALGLAGLTSMSVGGYLGGYLSHSRGIGINYAFHEHPPQGWTAVLDEHELTDDKPARVQAGDATVLMHRCNGQIYAIASRCSHAGGPLEEGPIDTATCTVTCPWHQSVFRLDDGGVVHGPASIPQASYDVRVQDGRIEIRHRP